VTAHLLSTTPITAQSRNLVALAAAFPRCPFPQLSTTTTIPFETRATAGGLFEEAPTTFDREEAERANVNAARER
jgi:hypothetical protein